MAARAAWGRHAEPMERVVPADQPSLRSWAVEVVTLCFPRWRRVARAAQPHLQVNLTEVAGRAAGPAQTAMRRPVAREMRARPPMPRVAQVEELSFLAARAASRAPAARPDPL